MSKFQGLFDPNSHIIELMDGSPDIGNIDQWAEDNDYEYIGDVENEYGYFKVFLKYDDEFCYRVYVQIKAKYVISYAERKERKKNPLPKHKLKRGIFLKAKIDMIMMNKK